MSARGPKGRALAKPKAVQARAVKPARPQGTTGLRAVKPARPQSAARLRAVKPAHPQGTTGLRTVKPARPQGAAALRTMSELMACAYALEAEASERYSEFAEAMEAHNNHQVAEMFRKLARIEHRHAEQILESMGWTKPPATPLSGFRWEGLEGPETAEVSALHYLMQPYHALQIALLNEKRAYDFFRRLAKSATTEKVRLEALAMADEEAEHVRLVEEWMKRTPVPAPGWDQDPDPPLYVD